MKFTAQLLLLFASALLLPSCENEDPIDDAGDAVEDAADEAQDAAEEAGDEIEDATDGQ